MRGQIALEQRHGGEAGRLFLSAASRFEPLDPDLARETYLEALGAAMANDVEVAGGAPAVAAAAATAVVTTTPAVAVAPLTSAVGCTWAAGTGCWLLSHHAVLPLKFVIRT